MVAHHKFLFSAWFGVNVTVNSYGHVKMVSSPNHTFPWMSFTKRIISTLCTYFLLQLTTTLLEPAEGGE